MTDNKLENAKLLGAQIATDLMASKPDDVAAHASVDALLLTTAIRTDKTNGQTNGQNAIAVALTLLTNAVHELNHGPISDADAATIIDGAHLGLLDQSFREDDGDD